MKTSPALVQWLKEGWRLLPELAAMPPELKEEARQLAQQLVEAASPSSPSPRLHLTVNEGVHPIVPALKRQYGKDIEYEEITHGNTDLDQEKAVARRVKEIVGKYPGAEFMLVPSGLPYIVTVAYNTIFQITSRHPVYLQLDRVNNRYIEKVLDPRELIL